MATPEYKFKVRNKTGDGYINILRDSNIEINDANENFTGDSLDEVLDELNDANDTLSGNVVTLGADVVDIQNLIMNWNMYTPADDGTVLDINSNSFIDTTTGVFTLQLPDNPTLGQFIRISDIGGDLEVNNLTIIRATSGELIMGLAEDIIADINWLGMTLTYSGNSSKGWVFTNKT